MLDPQSSSLLQGRRILIVEDDYLLAEDLRVELKHMGAEVLGPVARVGPALDLLSDGCRPDAAALDVNLGGELVYPVADLLLRRGVPFVFLTGYDRSSLPPAYAHVGCYEKPVDVHRLALEWAL